MNLNSKHYNLLHLCSAAEYFKLRDQGPEIQSEQSVSINTIYPERIIQHEDHSPR